MASLLEKFLDLHVGRAKTPGLASMLGLQDVGSDRYVAPPQADINGPIDEEALQYYLKRMGPIYPELAEGIASKIKPEAWAAALEAMPQSINVEDRRGRVKKGK
jgi:hypothetical protein